MIKVNFTRNEFTGNYEFADDSYSKLIKALSKVQARTKVRNINFLEADAIVLKMVEKLIEMLPGNEGIGAKITYVKGTGKSIHGYSGIPMGTRLIVTKHTGYATVQVDRYYANGAYNHNFKLDLSQVKRPEQVMQGLTNRALRYYQKNNDVKIYL